MRTCDHEECGWQAIAASPATARDQYARHLIDDHGEEVEIEIPDGKVEVRSSDDETWHTVSLEEAKRLHDRNHHSS